MAKTSKKYGLATSLLLSFLLIIGCTSQTPNGTNTSTAPAKPKYQVYTVEIKNMKFVPDSLVVNKGDEVVFVNRDMVNHCVTETKPDSNGWTSGPLQSGANYLLVTKKSVDYYCAIHIVMKGKIIVR